MCVFFLLRFCVSFQFQFVITSLSVIILDVDLGLGVGIGFYILSHIFRATMLVFFLVLIQFVRIFTLLHFAITLFN